MNKRKPWHFGLSARAKNVLSQDTMYLAGLKRNKKAIKAAVTSGRLQLRKLRNCGVKVTEEILRWIAL